MNLLLPPSKTPVSERLVIKFTALHQKVTQRLAPGTPEEVSLCNEVVVGLWHYRTFRAKAMAHERSLKLLENSSATNEAIEEVKREIAAAHRQAKHQKNFAWRRRAKYFDLKTERENRERFLKAA
jgi:hypothetical protein